MNLIGILVVVVSINEVSINGQLFSWILISRRSIKRAGTRLFCRGIDSSVSSIKNYQITFK